MIKLYNGDCLEVLKTLEPESVNCCVTSPPYYGLRDYGVEGQLGLEKTPGEYVQNLVNRLRGVKRVLKNDGTVWLNLGDSYTGGGRGGSNAEFIGKGTHNAQKLGKRDAIDGLPSKNLIGIPWKVAFALQEDGWFLRQDIIWKKKNPMPESVKDRCTKSHEYIFLLTKLAKYYYDYEAIKEPSTCGDNGSRFDIGKTGMNKNRNWEKRPSAPKGSFNGKTEAMAKTGQNAFRAVSETRNKRSVWESEDHELLVQWLSENNPEILKQYFDTVPDVWDISTVPFKGAHFAVFPPKLARNCILAGCPKNGVVIDPFSGSGTVGKEAKESGRDFVGIELKPEYHKMGEKRINKSHYQMSF